MTRLDNSLPAVLRRRATALVDSYSPEFISTLLRAADELEIRQRCASDDEQVAVEAIAGNRRLRKTLTQVYERIKMWPLAARVKNEVFEIINGALQSTTEFGRGRPSILSIQVRDGMTRAEFEAKVSEMLDKIAFTKGDSDGQKENPAAQEPSGAGRDPDQPASPEETS